MGSSQAIMPSAQAVELALVEGDLSQLTAEQRIAYLKQVCESVGLNPLTKPFEYVRLNGKLVLYARKDATDQLRRVHNVSIIIANRERVDDAYIVTARATMPDGRCDESTGVVTLGGLKGDNLANALMKCETKAKRRVTLSICGLGLLDETELETVPGAQIVPTPTIVEAVPRPQLAAAPPPPVVVAPTRLEQQLTKSIEATQEVKAQTEDYMSSILNAPTLSVLDDLVKKFVGLPEEVRKPLRAAFTARQKYLMQNRSKRPAAPKQPVAEREPGQDG